VLARNSALGRPQLKAVFFDMDGTLVHLPRDFSAPRFLQRVLQGLGLEVELGRLERAYEQAEAWWQELFADDYTRWTRENFVEFNRRLLASLELDRSGGPAVTLDDLDLERLAGRVQDHWERLPEEAGELLYPEVPQALEGLRRRGLTLGILSNRTLPAIQSSLRRHGLSSYFQCLVSPQRAGAPRGKLDRAMWEYALSQLGVAPEEAAHIGDRYEDDVVGARSAGLLPILIDREGRYKECDCPRISKLTEVLRLLE